MVPDVRPGPHRVDEVRSRPQTTATVASPVRHFCLFVVVG